MKQVKVGFSVLMLVMLVLSSIVAWGTDAGAVPQTVDPPTGSGTEQDPYVFTTKEQFDNGQYRSYFANANNYIKLGNSIDFTGSTYTEAVVTDPLQAKFDGNGFSLRNFNINVPSQSNNSYGFFRTINATGELTNIDIRDATATIDSTRGAFGFVAGEVYGNVDRVAVRNSTVTATDTESELVIGGITGRLLGTGVFTQNSFRGTLDVVSAEGIGGLVGTSTRPITLSYADINISNYETVSREVSIPLYVGGLVGEMNGGASLTVNYVRIGDWANSFLQDGVKVRSGYLVGKASNAFPGGAIQQNYVYFATIPEPPDVLFGDYNGNPNVFFRGNYYDSGENDSIPFGLATNHLKSQSFLEAQNPNCTPACSNSQYDFTEVWGIDPMLNNGYPHFQWEYPPAPPAYNVIYTDGNYQDITGEPPTDTTEYRPGDTFTVLGPNTLARPNRIFIGWEDDRENPYEEGDQFTMSDSDLTLYPIFARVYTVTYDANTGAGTVPVDDGRYRNGDEASVLSASALSKAGHRFVSWNTKADGTGDSYQPNDKLTITADPGNVTLYAIWEAIPGSGSGGGNGGGGTIVTPPGPTIPADGGSDGTPSVQIPITRVANGDGTFRDSVTMTGNQARELVQLLLDAGRTTARITLPDADDTISEARLTIPQEALRVLAEAGLTLEIATRDGRVIVPNASASEFTDDLFFLFRPVKDEEGKSDVETRAKSDEQLTAELKTDTLYVVGRPMTIETNMQERLVELEFPIPAEDVPTDGTRTLKMFIEHSDGTKEVKDVEVIERDGAFFVRFTTTKFSTFTVINGIAVADVEEPITGTHAAYIRGFADGTFRPEADVTRAEVAVMLARLLHVDGGQATSGFADVPSSHWASGAISFMKTQGLFVGDPSGAFRPNDAITRGEFATVVARYKNLEARSAAFTDTHDHWASNSIGAIASIGIVNGYPDGSFRPQANVSRAEAVTMLNRLFERGPLTGVSTPTWPDVSATHWAFADIEEASHDHRYVIIDDEEQLLSN